MKTIFFALVTLLHVIQTMTTITIFNETMTTTVNDTSLTTGINNVYGYTFVATVLWLTVIKRWKRDCFPTSTSYYQRTTDL